MRAGKNAPNLLIPINLPVNQRLTKSLDGIKTAPMVLTSQPGNHQPDRYGERGVRKIPNRPEMQTNDGSRYCVAGGPKVRRPGSSLRPAAGSNDAPATRLRKSQDFFRTASCPPAHPWHDFPVSITRRAIGTMIDAFLFAAGLQDGGNSFYRLGETACTTPVRIPRLLRVRDRRFVETETSSGLGAFDYMI